MEWINMFLSTFIIQYYSKVVFFFFLIAHYLNWIIKMNIRVQFIIITSYDELITNKI